MCIRDRPNERVERRRGQIGTGIKIREQDTRDVAGQMLRQLVYPPDHPYSRQTDGQIETISAIARDHLADFHRLHYGPRGMLIVVVGAVDTADVIRWVDERFGDWENPDQPEIPALPDVPTPDEVRAQHRVTPGKSQADSGGGFPGPARPHLLANDTKAESSSISLSLKRPSNEGIVPPPLRICDSTSDLLRSCPSRAGPTGPDASAAARV